MVVVHRAQGFRFVTDTAGHEPTHIQLTGAGQAKINLLGPGGSAELVWSVGIKRSDMRRVLAQVTQRQADFLQQWERIHGRPD